jgi:hypothetical protein
VEFYKKIAPSVALLKDGHTGVYPPYEEYEQFKKQGGRIFPLDLDIQTGHTYIKANYSDDTLITKGTELLSINGKPIQEIVTELAKYISAERTVTKYEYLEGQFRLRPWLIYKWEGPFEIGIKTKDGLTNIVKVPGITVEELKAKQKQLKKETLIYYTYSYLPEIKAGLIDFRWFSDYNQFKEFLKKTFTQMKADGAENLIIDIRKNSGGNAYLGELFFTYLTNNPFTQISYQEVKSSKQLKSFYRKLLPWYIGWIPFQWFVSEARKLWKTPNGQIATYKYQPKQPKTNKLLFKGNIFVLISNYTFSSATMFATTIKDFKIGTLIGEETGGLATSYGDIYPFDLPNTRISVGVSHSRFVRPSGEDDGKGVLPDYEVSQTQEDIALGRDAVLEFTKNLIKTKKR